MNAHDSSYRDWRQLVVASAIGLVVVLVGGWYLEQNLQAVRQSFTAVPLTNELGKEKTRLLEAARQISQTPPAGVEPAPTPYLPAV